MPNDIIELTSSGKCVVKLSWELPLINDQISQESAHPERQEWSDFLYEKIEQNFDIFISANDIEVIIPNLEKFRKNQLVTYISELFSAIALYECDWRPDHSVIDVNGEKLPDKMATGLFQLNVEDQKSFNTGTAYNHVELRQALPNIDAAVGIMVNQIKKTGRIILAKNEKGIFWAVLHPRGSFDKTDKILAMVHSLKIEPSS
jgi:hypothetical protein